MQTAIVAMVIIVLNLLVVIKSELRRRDAMRVSYRIQHDTMQTQIDNMRQTLMNTEILAAAQLEQLRKRDVEICDLKRQLGRRG